MSIKQFGFKIDPEDFNEVSNELEIKGINYDIWNAEDVFLGTATQVEFNVTTQEDADVLKSIIEKRNRARK